MHDREAFGSALSFQDTLQLTQLALGAAVLTKSLLSIFKEPMILEEARRPPVNDIHKDCEFRTDTIDWTEL